MEGNKDVSSQQVIARIHMLGLGPGLVLEMCAWNTCQTLVSALAPKRENYPSTLSTVCAHTHTHTHKHTHTHTHTHTHMQAHTTDSVYYYRQHGDAPHDTCMCCLVFWGQEAAASHSSGRGGVHSSNLCVHGHTWPPASGAGEYMHA